jgi:alkylated DNA repair dioxygenase AlkB
MSQLSLFGTGPLVLLDDASGRIVYTPEAVPAATARAWFERLRAEIPWQHHRRSMYEREVDMPRLRAHYALDDPALPAVLAEAAAAVARLVPAPFDSVGLNFYRDRRDSVAPHNDKLHRLAAGQPIALLSLGAARRMVVRAKHPPRRALRLDLETGSLLLMSYATQLHYDHGIPKERGEVGPRISLAFRVHGQAAVAPAR